jgi:hypothetical protein
MDAFAHSHHGLTPSSTSPSSPSHPESHPPRSRHSDPRSSCEEPRTHIPGTKARPPCLQQARWSRWIWPERIAAIPERNRLESSWLGVYHWASLEIRSESGISRRELAINAQSSSEQKSYHRLHFRSRTHTNCFPAPQTHILLQALSAQDPAGPYTHHRNSNCKYTACPTIVEKTETTPVQSSKHRADLPKSPHSTSESHHQSGSGRTQLCSP